MVPAALLNSVEKWLSPPEITDRWSQAAQAGPGAAIFAQFLERTAWVSVIAPSPILRIPRTGPAVVVANHPFEARGKVQGARLVAHTDRPDVKFLANSRLSGLHGLEPFFIPVNPFGNAAQSNRRALRRSIEWLRQGGLLVTFPSGEVASLRSRSSKSRSRSGTRTSLASSA